MKEILYIIYFSVTSTVSVPCDNSVRHATDPITGEEVRMSMMLAIACSKDVTETYTRQFNEADYKAWRKNVDQPFSKVRIIRLETLKICSRDTLVSDGK